MDNNGSIDFDELLTLMENNTVRNTYLAPILQNILPTTSVTRKKSPNVYKSFPKMISLEK